MPNGNAGVIALASQVHQVASAAATANNIMNCSTQNESSSSHNNRIKNSYNNSLAIEQQLSTENDLKNIGSSNVSNSFDNCINGSVTTSYGQDLTVYSIRNNVTRVLNLYFKNVSDEYGYGAATTTPFSTTTATTTTLLPANAIMNKINGTVNDANLKQYKMVTESSTASSNRSLIGDNAMLNAISTLLQKTQIANITKSNTLFTDQVVNNSTDTKANSTIPTSITFPSFGIHNYENCSSLFMYFNKPHQGEFIPMLK